MNFGLESNGVWSNYEIGKNNPQTIIGPDNFSALNQIIHQEKPVNQAHLSRRNLNTQILQNLQHTNYNDFEIVVAENKTTISDLIYFWNRLLYKCKNILYVTVQELLLLCEDKFFGGVLYDMSSDDTIHVVSMTLSKIEIEELITSKLKSIAFYRRFQYKDISDFPFDISNSGGLFERDFGESVTTQTIISNKGILQLPKLSFTDKVGFFPQKWVLDIEIIKGGSNPQGEMKFPFTTETQYIITGVKGRINRRRRISIFIHNQQNASDFIPVNIPEFKHLLTQLISSPIIHGLTQNTKYCRIGLHDSSNKLAAFLKLFDFNFKIIDDFFTDKFWVELFEGLITNQKIAGDSITFDEINSKAIEALKQAGVIQIVAPDH